MKNASCSFTPVKWCLLGLGGASGAACLGWPVLATQARPPDYVVSGFCGGLSNCGEFHNDRATQVATGVEQQWTPEPEDPLHARKGCASCTRWFGGLQSAAKSCGCPGGETRVEGWGRQRLKPHHKHHQPATALILSNAAQSCATLNRPHPLQLNKPRRWTLRTNPQQHNPQPSNSPWHPSTHAHHLFYCSISLLGQCLPHRMTHFSIRNQSLRNLQCATTAR